MPRKKQSRHEENRSAERLVQEGHRLFETIKGQWSDLFFHNQSPITLELACGRGEYTSGLASLFPQRNFIGIDIKGERIWHAIRHAQENNLKNLACLRAIIQNIEDFFDENEVAEIRIVHPDPRPKNKDEKRRITYKRFMDSYKKILKPWGILRLKTDDTDLFDYTCRTIDRNDRELLEKTEDLYNSSLKEEHYGIVTRYERIFTKEGRTIKYAKRRNKKD